MSERISFAGTIEVEGRRLKGSVALNGQQTVRNGEMVEVDLRALLKADRSKAVAVVGHQAFGGDLGYDPLRTVARADNNSLRITPTAEGFDWETDDLPNTSYANDALELARAKVFGGTSFDIIGARSTVKTDPGGTRIRRYTSIRTFAAVTPVVDPAFPSTVAAFSKGEDMAENETPAPEPQPEPPAEPAKFTEQPKAGQDWAAFAKDLEPEQLEGAMEAIFARASGDPKGNELDQYQAFSKELQSRRRESADAKQRISNLKFAHDLAMGRVPKAPAVQQTETPEAKAMFNAYLRGESREWESFAQSIAGDGTQGGYAVPDGFLNRITESQLAYGGIASVADSITTSDGQPLRWPSNDDTANSAVIAAEGSAAGSGGADLVFGSVTLGAYSYDATGASNLPLLVSKELLQDAAFDIEGFIARKLGERIGRKQAADFATGNGSSKPYGLLSKTPDTMTATTMFAAVIEHMFQVDAAYRNSGNCRWVLSDTTLAKAYASVDGNGRPLFIAASDASAASRPTGFIMGYPVTIDNGAGDLVAFGDIRLGYIIRYVRGVQVDVDPYTNIKSRQVAYHAWARADANIQDTAAYSVSDYSTVSADS